MNATTAIVQNAVKRKLNDVKNSLAENDIDPIILSEVIDNPAMENNEDLFSNFSNQRKQNKYFVEKFGKNLHVFNYSNIEQFS